MRKLIALLPIIIGLASGHQLPRLNKVNPHSDWRIVGGSNAARGQFPYQVSLRYFGSHNCGGSIINSYWILTAAHCVINYPPSQLSIIVGSDSLSEGGTSYEVSKAIYNAKYNAQLIQNDVAVLKLSRPLNFSDVVRPIRLETEDVGSVDCVISGWGRTSYPGDIPNDLQFVELKTISVRDCQSRWIFNPVVETQICTLTKSGEGVCHGDSGGPLVADGKQIGIVSWGNPCANGIPDVYTRVSSFHEWIENAMRE